LREVWTTASPIVWEVSSDPQGGPKGWCVCGQKVTIAGAVEITLPNGRDGWEGRCPECGAPLFAIRRKPRAA
jgi:hypothetical protein